MRGAPAAAALLLAALLLSIPFAAAAEGTLHRYEVQWGEMRAERSWDGTLAEGDVRTHRLNVSQDNLTSVEFLLTWVETGDDFRVSSEDTFRVSVRDPDGREVAGGAVQGASGLLTLREEGLNPLPRPLSLSAATQADVNAKVAAYRSTVGMGLWTVTVRLVDTGNPSGTTVDKGNTYVLTVVLRYYEAGVSRVVTLEPPATGLLMSVDPEGPWFWATLGLTGAAALLGGLIVADRVGWNPFRKSP